MIIKIATIFPELIQIEAAVFIQGGHFLSSTSIISSNYSRAATIKGAEFNQVNMVPVGVGLVSLLCLAVSYVYIYLVLYAYVFHYLWYTIEV